LERIPPGGDEPRHGHPRRPRTRARGSAPGAPLPRGRSGRTEYDGCLDGSLSAQRVVGNRVRGKLGDPAQHPVRIGARASEGAARIARRTLPLLLSSRSTSDRASRGRPCAPRRSRRKG
jgi:hypothetical protein